MLKYTLVLIASLLVTLTSFGQSTKKYPSLLWEITGNGMTKPSYLYGTMHVSERIAYHLSDTFFIALKKCDMVALESDPTTWLEDKLGNEDFRRMSNYYRYNSGFIENDFLVDSYEKRDLRQMFSAEPSIINGMMYRNNYGRYNYQEDTYLDMFIFQSGRKMGKVVTNLEDNKISQEMVAKAYKREKGEKYDYDDEDYYENGRDLYESIEDAYRNGDLDLLDSLQDMKNKSKNFRKWMLDERNKIMVHGMDSIMKSKTLFTAVGAAHLPGKMGIIELLREMGYTVRPVKYTSTKTGIKAKEKLENLFYPVPFKKYNLNNGEINYSSTSELIEIPVYKDGGQFFVNMEMVNGTYCLLMKLRTRALIENKSADYIYSQIDSMLFENVPGKILNKKKSLSPEGYPILEMAVKTKQADYIRYKVFVTPFEILVFTLGGKGELVMKKEYDQYFSDIKINIKKGEWSEEKFETQGFKVNLPGLRFSGDENQTSGQTFSSDAYDPESGDYFVTIRNQFNDLRDLESDTFELSYLVDHIVKREEYEVLKKQMEYKNGYPVMTAKLKKNERFLHLKFLMDKHNYYMLSVFSKSDIPNEKYFQSFEYLHPADTQKYEIYKDTSCFFTVNMPKSITENMDYSFDYGSRRHYSYRDYDYDFDEDDLEEDDSHRSVHINKQFINGQTGEIIGLSYEKFSKYEEMTDKANYLKNKLYADFSEGEYRWKNLTNKETNNGLEISYHLVDTASVRIIKVKHVFNNGTHYSFRHYTDSISTPSKFASEFFATFKPNDTVIGQDYFTDKTKLFFEDLNGDTTQRKKAVELFYEVNFTDEDAPELIKCIQNPEFFKLEKRMRLDLYRELSQLKHPDVLPYLNNLYTKAGDSTDLQFIVLKGMLMQKTKAGHESFLKNIIANTPLSDDKELAGLFMPLFDSVELSKSLFPQILELTQFEEFKLPIYALFVRLADSNLVNKDMFKSKLNLISREANEYIKRTVSDQIDQRPEYKNDISSQMEEIEKLIAENPSMRSMIERELREAGISMDEIYKLSDVSYSTDKLMTYGKIFMLFKDDPLSKSFFEKVEKSQNKSILYSLHILYLMKDIPVADSVWKNYSADPMTRIMVYKALKSVKKENLFDSFYYTQQSFAESDLVTDQNLDLKKDTIEYLDKYYVINKFDTGYVFVYKFKEEGRERWELFFSGYHPLDPLKINTNPTYNDTKYFYTKKQEKMDKIIKEEMDELRLIGRKRIDGGRDYDYSEEAYEEY